MEQFDSTLSSVIDSPNTYVIIAFGVIDEIK